MSSRKQKALTEPRPEVIALLQEIKRNPHDDTPRLVLADWLEEHDDPRGTFLRSQLAHPRTRLVGASAPALTDEEAKIVNDHSPGWKKPLYRARGGWTYHRGLVRAENYATVLNRVPWDRYVDTEAIHWIDELWVRAAFYDWPNVAKCPLFQGLNYLTLLDVQSSDLVKTLVVKPETFPHLIGLRLDYWMEDAGAPYHLLDSPLCQNLRQLVIQTARGRFFEHQMHTNLRLEHLELHNVPVCDGLELAVGLSQLTHLIVEGSKADLSHLPALLRKSNPHKLRSLWLEGCRLNNPHLEKLAESTELRPTLLALSNNNFSSAGAVALAEAPLLSNVECLAFNLNTISQEAVVALVSSKQLTKLRYLALNGCRLDDSVAEALLETSWSESLQYVDLAGNNFNRRNRERLQEQFGDRLNLNSAKHGDFLRIKQNYLLAQPDGP